METRRCRNRWRWPLLTVLLLLAAQAPASAQPTSETPETTAPAPSEPASDAPETSFTTIGSPYLDNASPMNNLRLRFDAAYGMNRWDRAEYLYLQGGVPRVDYQNVSAYLELTADQNLSGFVEMNLHFLNPDSFADATGLGDMNVGFKWAFWINQDQVQSFQMRVFIPTGNPLLGLGSSHASLEPGLLFTERLSPRWVLQGMFKDWIPLTSDTFAGNILIYGGALNYRAFDNGALTVCPIAEFVGWTVLSGKESITAPPIVPLNDDPTFFPVKSAAGDTIVNAKVGVRASWGEHSFYAGYGRALTGDFWYKNLYRIEYRFVF
jgi:hypothetical protein